ncbi:vacuolar protein sorting-associated protein 37A-like [Saccoglossus kowalevskii]
MAARNSRWSFCSTGPTHWLSHVLHIYCFKWSSVPTDKPLIHLLLRYNPSNLLTHLKIASAEAEEESEKIADLFLDKQIDIESFVQQFMEKRKLCHTRKGKEEKLMQMADRRY